MTLCDRLLSQTSRQCLIFVFTFFVGIYFMSYTLSFPFISRPIDHFCAPPFDFHREHRSPKDWKTEAIPYWDQVPDHLKSVTLRPKTQSKCLQYSLVDKNPTNGSSHDYEIDYKIESITHCKNGWYYKDKQKSILSQFELVCDKRWVLQVLPLIATVGFILSTAILYFECHTITLILSSILMVIFNLVIIWISQTPLLFIFKFLSALFFGSTFYLIITLMTRAIEKAEIKSLDIIFFAGLLGSIFGKGLTLLMIHTIEDWKVVHVVNTFSLLPICIFGIIIYIVQVKDTSSNINFVDDIDDTSQGSPEEPGVLPNGPRISQKFQFILLWITAFLYFCEDYAQHQKVEKNHELFDPKFICIQTFNVLMIYLSKRRISLKYTILAALISVCLSNSLFSISGMFDYQYRGVWKTSLEYMNKIGVSIAFYSNLFIFVELIDKRNTLFNITLVNTIIFSYGMCPLALKLNEINDWIIRTVLSSSSLLAISLLVFECFVADKTLNTIKTKRAKNNSVFYSPNDLTDDKLYIVNEEL